jgi:hypothetical protein
MPILAISTPLTKPTSSPEPSAAIEAGERQDRGEAEVDLAGSDDEGEPGRKQHQRRQRREERRVDVRLAENLGREIDEQEQQRHEHHDDRQRLEARHHRLRRVPRHGSPQV